MEVDLSVIVPCFNEEANIKELARRVLNTFERGGLEGELVLVDDGSSDRTADIIRQVEGEHLTLSNRALRVLRTPPDDPLPDMIRPLALRLVVGAP